MFVMLEWESQRAECAVLNVLYTDDAHFANDWVRSYLKMQIASLEYTPKGKGEKSVGYIIEETPGSFVLVKVVDQLHPGYIYNTTETIHTKLFEIEVLPFSQSLHSIHHDAQFEPTSTARAMKFDINKRALKKMDSHTMYKVMCKICRTIGTKMTWYRDEYMDVLSHIIRSAESNGVDVSLNKKLD